MFSLLPKPLAEINSYCHANREQGTCTFLYITFIQFKPSKNLSSSIFCLPGKAHLIHASTLPLSWHQELIIPTQTVPQLWLLFCEEQERELFLVISPSRRKQCCNTWELSHSPQHN